MSLNLRNNSSGFTLLEVLIAMAILVFISFAIYQATTETYKLRDVLSIEGNFYNSIRLCTSIMQQDVALIYSPVISTPSPTPSQNPGAPPTQPGNPLNVLPDDLPQSFTFWSAAIDATGLRPSRFIGTENKMSFISLSHHRIYKDSPESEFAKVTYEIKKEDRSAAIPDAYVLVKTESPNAFARDDYRDQFNRSYDLLHGIKKLSYTYYLRDGNTWKNFRSWDSDKEETKNRFPDIIELNLEVIGPKNLSFEGKFKFRPEIPLNGLNPKI
jgi:prepilin-type N-terminal cleavage/methylation domain-containing protein